MSQCWYHLPFLRRAALHTSGSKLFLPMFPIAFAQKRESIVTSITRASVSIGMLVTNAGVVLMAISLAGVTIMVTRTTD